MAVLHVLVALAALVALVEAAGPAAPLLLAVGSVTDVAARVMVDGAPAATALHLRVYHAKSATAAPPVYLADRELSLAAVRPEDGGRPQVVELDGLSPSTSYRVEIWSETEQAMTPEQVQFRTAPPPTSTESARVLVVSCDRFVDDHDDVLWTRFAQDMEQAEAGSAFYGTAHVGDQVYVDAGVASIPIVPFPIKDASDSAKVATRFEELVQAFRSIYRTTFGRPALQRVLRSGANWMLPDDHEVLNNLNRERVQLAFAGWNDTRRDADERSRLFELTLHYRAGIQVFYEFQYQLQHEFPWSSIDFLADPLQDIVRRFPIHFSAEVGALKLFFLDARFDRAFMEHKTESDSTRLIGPEQHKHLADKLSIWKRGQHSSIVVLSNLPLFFHSPLSASIAYMVEQETYPGRGEEFAGLESLYALLRHGPSGDQRPVVDLLVGGDVHMMAHSHVCDAPPSTVCFDQLITSGATNGSTAMEDTKLLPFYYLVTRLTPLADLVLDWVERILEGFDVGSTRFIAKRASWRLEFDRVFLGRNYGYDHTLPMIARDMS